MRIANLVALVLVVVGALNWALVGLFEFDLVATIVGEDFGEVNAASRVIYILVGLAGLYLLSQVPRLMEEEDESRVRTSQA